MDKKVSLANDISVKIDATDSKKYPHDDKKGRLKLLQDIHQLIKTESASSSASSSQDNYLPYKFNDVACSLKLLEEYIPIFNLLVKKGRIKIGKATENPCGKNKDDGVASIRKNVAKREAFSNNLTLEKREALQPIAKQLTTEQIKKVGSLSIEEIEKRIIAMEELYLPAIAIFLSVERIKVFDHKDDRYLLKNLTLKQIIECESFQPKILAKYRYALAFIKSKKVADVIRNAQIKEAIEIDF